MEKTRSDPRQGLGEYVMSQSSAWIAMEKQYYAQTVQRQPVVLVRGQGCRVWDVDGKEYLGVSHLLHEAFLGMGSVLGFAES
jgi:acetylornithine/succinyldiaminopimelate/putrescine aminotransferase